jgi:hypothetical protein
MDAPERVVIWRPQPGPQNALITCPVFEIFYGGARGGGKTDGMLGEWIAHAGRYGEAASGLMVRRTREELYDTIERSRQLYTLLGAKLTDNLWRFPNGARLRFAYLERDSDAEAYQGHNYTRVYIEELGNFPNPAPVFKMMATLRSAKGVPTGFRASGNPGGPGHQWVRARYIDPAPHGMQVITDAESGLQRVFIPAKVSDNKILTDSDPSYVARLKQSGSPELVRAWLDGDWSVIAGAFFPEFSMVKHVIRPFTIPEHWARYRSMDWGSARPFAVYWMAVSDGDDTPYPRGSLVVYREWYGMQPNQPNVGLKLTAEEVADGILSRESGEELTGNVIDPAAFNSDGGPSIAERMLVRGCFWGKADNKRVGQRGMMGGWDQLRQRLKGFDGKPMLYIFDTCAHLIRTLPALQHDEKRPEDVDTEAEDHAPDALRYGVMARPMVQDAPSKPEARFPQQQTINEIIQARVRARQE